MARLALRSDEVGDLHLYAPEPGKVAVADVKNPHRPRLTEWPVPIKRLLSNISRPRTSGTPYDCPWDHGRKRYDTRVRQMRTFDEAR
ncbi:hypothetical protein Mth01_19690 [Sphaerimonospora thailandensis]|uniref:Uncharacterized protein n=1 Tax=Sphaerimonospora thailandensis TaxID=795644 RepID=A0A8J3R5N7_9ACTN|nr:hypothetical protein Mth01_19690 [Sphaerimonospora thailandensis]